MSNDLDALDYAKTIDENIFKVTSKSLTELLHNQSLLAVACD